MSTDDARSALFNIERDMPNTGMSTVYLKVAMRKLMIFVIYMTVIGVIIYYSIATAPSIDEMRASLDTHVPLPKTPPLLGLIGSHAGAIFFFAPFFVSYDVRRFGMAGQRSHGKAAVRIAAIVIYSWDLLLLGFTAFWRLQRRSWSMRPLLSTQNMSLGLNIRTGWIFS